MPGPTYPYNEEDFDTKDLWLWCDSIQSGTVHPPEEFSQPDIAKISEAITS